MKKVLLTLLAIVVTLGVLAGAGFVGYRIGNNRRALAPSPSNGAPQIFNKQQDGFGKQGFDPQGMPMHNFGRDAERGFGMMQYGRGHGRGFGFFSPVFFLVKIVVFVLIIWLAYKLIKGSGWKLSLTHQTPASPKAEPVDSETKNS